MNRRMQATIVGVLFLICTASAFAQNRSVFNGTVAASDFAYGWTPSPLPGNPALPGAPALRVSAFSGTVAAGASGTLTLDYGTSVTASGIKFSPFFQNGVSFLPPITIGVGTANETVTPSAVSCSTPDIQQTCTVTATFTYAHGPGDIVRSGTFGLQEALDFISKTGGTAGIDASWSGMGGTTAIITAAIPQPNTAIADTRTQTPTYWTIQPTASTALAVPVALTTGTMAAVSSPVGAYTTGNYVGCISDVDFMGNEGACSPTSGNIAGVATGSFVFTAPPAATGVVGYTVYISLVSGAYTAMYQVPLTSSICTLTTVETITPACAVTNTTYGQTGSNATVSALTVNTSMTAINSAVIGTATVVHGNAIAKATYGYVPGSTLATSGIQGVYFPATGAAATSATLDTVATLAIPAGYMQIGRKLRVCGNATMSAGSTATILGVDLIWDGNGQDTAAAPVIVSTNTLTPASALSASVVQYNFCQTLVPTVIGTTVTGGTILAGAGQMCYSVTAPGTVAYCGPVTTVGTTGSLNLLGPNRLHVAFIHTTGTDGAATILQNLTVESL
jgi:hypothetical protein